jgi:2-polyprenyl-3-methyl-5-hydroxy-6-metoxy-1,4-benzoquinol methylase
MIGNNSNLLKVKSDYELSGRELYVNNIFLKNINFSGRTVCEVGPGFGWFVKFLVDQKAKKIDVYDINLENKEHILSLANATDSVIEFKNPTDVFSFGEKKYDYIFAFEVMEHIKPNSELKFMKALKNALDENGVLIMSTPSDDIRAKYLDPALYLTGHRHYGIKHYKKYSDIVGLKVIDYELAGGWFAIIDLYNLYIAKWIFRRKRFFEDFFKRRSTLDYFNNKKPFNTVMVKMKIKSKESL